MPLIGVAIAIPEPYAAQLQARRASYGDVLAGSIPTHVTLLPPTEVSPELMPAAVAHLGSVATRHEPFPIVLRGAGTFRPVSPVVFVELAAGTAECVKLQSDVRDGVLDRDLAFDYYPHVTVAHHVTPEALDRAATDLLGFECAFSVDGFHLYEHGEDGVWRPVQTFTFPRRRPGSGLRTGGDDTAGRDSS